MLKATSQTSDSGNNEISPKDKPGSKTNGSQSESEDKTQENSVVSGDTSVSSSGLASEEEVRKKGNGHLEFDAYTGAETIHCSHPDHNSADLCPQYRLGSLFKMADPGRETRLFSQGGIGHYEF